MRLSLIPVLIILGCFVGWPSLSDLSGTARRSNQSILKESVLNIHWNGWCWSWSSNTLAPDVKNWLSGKDPDVGKDWRQEKKWMTEDDMVGWRHWLNGHELEQTPRIGDGQGRLACYSLWGHKESTWLSNLTDFLVSTVKVLCPRKIPSALKTGMAGLFSG